MKKKSVFSPSMLKMKSLAVCTSRAVWSPNSPCSSCTSSCTCEASCSSGVPERKSTSDTRFTGAGARGVTALLIASIEPNLQQHSLETQHAGFLRTLTTMTCVWRERLYYGNFKIPSILICPNNGILVQSTILTLQLKQQNTLWNDKYYNVRH